jgi:dTDP-4-dehydrorhamnose reductase
MRHVLVLGSSGMLGSAVVKEFVDFSGAVSATIRMVSNESHSSKVTLLKFDAANDDLRESLSGIDRVDYVINCIGVIKPHIKDSDAKQRANAIAINGLFPYSLESWSREVGAKVLQIATDCVFSGSRGAYLESDEHDALDVYGKTKSLGEVPSNSMMHLRVSIIGPEIGRSTSLLEWVRNQPKGAEISGYTDHLWNGITTLHFAKIARGIVEADLFSPGVFHVLPKDDVTKHELVSSMARHLGRNDIAIKPVSTGDGINRTLRTRFPEVNQRLWEKAGYACLPDVDKMVSEVIAWDSAR